VELLQGLQGACLICGLKHNEVEVFRSVTDGVQEIESLFRSFLDVKVTMTSPVRVSTPLVQETWKKLDFQSSLDTL
jgi:hypothetical protein